MPELRKRGIFHEDYAVPGGTYRHASVILNEIFANSGHRENFYEKQGQTRTLPEHVASKYRWEAGVSREKATFPE